MKNKVTCEVEIGSSLISGVLNVELKQSLDDTHSFSIYLRQSVFLKDQPFDFLDKNITDQFLSKEVNINLQHDRGDSISFNGLITRVVLQSSKDFDHYILFEGEGLPAYLNGGVTRKTFVDRTLKEIVEEVAKRSNLPHPIKVDTAFSGKIPFVMQYDETNFQFLRRLAYDFGEWFYFDGNEVYFGKRNPSKESPEFTINGDQIASREAAMFAVGTNAWTYHDPDDKMLTAEKSADSSIFQDTGTAAVALSENIYGANHFYPNRPAMIDFSNQSEVDSMCEHYSQQHSIYLDTVSGHSIFPNLYPGADVKVDLHYPAQGDLRSNEPIKQDIGDFMITSVTHQFGGNDDYRAVFRAVSAKNKVQPFAVVPPSPRVGNELATVEDNQDKDGSGRVKCIFLWSNLDEKHCKTNWIRMISPYTADGDGFVWLPEKKSQVMIGFYQGSSYRPYIIGSLYHGKHQSEIGHSPDNNLSKQFMTASGNQVLFDDTKGKEFVLITNKHKKDAFFKISFSPVNKITLTCNGDIDLIATQNINMEADNISMKAGSKLSIEAGQETEIKTANLKVNADAKADISSGGPMKIDSSATAEVSSGAVLTIKGSLVKIN